MADEFLLTSIKFPFWAQEIHKKEYIWIITSRQRSCNGHVFSRVSHCVHGGGGNQLPSVQGPGPALFPLTCSTSTSLYRASSPSPNMFKFVHYEARTVGE